MLDGIRVVDLSRFIAGPMCAMLLADFGADVVKVERQGGEDARHIARDEAGNSLYSNWYNRNKRAIELNLRDPRGIAVLETLVSEADVLVENFRPGTLDGMGLTADRLRELNPRLVVASLSGFGQDGPWRERAAFDSVIQAMTGLMSLTGTDDTGPLLAGAFVADHLAALYGTIGVLAALRSREATGEGQQVDVALFDALFSVLGLTVPTFTETGTRLPPIGRRDRFTAPSQVFGTRDGHVWLSAGSNALFASLAATVDDERLRAPEFSEPAMRVANRDALASVVEAWTSQLTTTEVCELLERSRIPYGPVATIDQVVTSDHVRHRELLVTMPHPTLGACAVPGITAKLSASPATLRRPPPALGEHTDEVLRVLCHLMPDEIEELKRDGVV
ncbi:CaiB/BaiF CoA-transferase family protein [Pseudonocardia ailaonensis]|uniref:CaiB/BaiF CoA-transferase family protein n=1 Tax=Pseudonocardia ailaonensis TaxID=367279 RepID=A0ABN2N0P7_9PSEU